MKQNKKYVEYYPKLTLLPSLIPFAAVIYEKKRMES